MYVDVKVEVWQRIKLHEGESVTKEQVIEILDKMNINSLWDIEDAQADFETLLETEEYMYPADNDGQSTVELYNEDGELLWDNSIKE